MKSSYRLIKLRNGEDLICEIKGQTKDKLKLFRPMLVHTQIVANPFGKTGKMTTLQNWVEHTLDNDIKIPKDFVLTFSPPNESIIELYEKYKNSEDVDTKKPTVWGPGLSDPDPSKDMDGLKKLFNSFDEEDDEEDNQIKDELNFLVMTLMVPPSILRELIEDGVIDSKDIASYMQGSDFIDMDDERKDTTTETDHPNYGNRWTDWSIDLNDYLKGNEEQ